LIRTCGVIETSDTNIHQQQHKQLQQR